MADVALSKSSPFRARRADGGTGTGVSAGAPATGRCGEICGCTITARPDAQARKACGRSADCPDGHVILPVPIFHMVFLARADVPSRPCWPAPVVDLSPTRTCPRVCGSTRRARLSPPVGLHGPRSLRLRRVLKAGGWDPARLPSQPSMARRPRFSKSTFSALRSAPFVPVVQSVRHAVEKVGESPPTGPLYDSHERRRPHRGARPQLPGRSSLRPRRTETGAGGPTDVPAPPRVSWGTPTMPARAPSASLTRCWCNARPRGSLAEKRTSPDPSAARWTIHVKRDCVRSAPLRAIELAARGARPQRRGLRRASRAPWPAVAFDLVRPSLHRDPRATVVEAGTGRRGIGRSRSRPSFPDRIEIIGQMPNPLRLR